MGRKCPPIWGRHKIKFQFLEPFQKRKNGALRWAEKFADTRKTYDKISILGGIAKVGKAIV